MAVAQLAGDGEAILVIARRGRAVEQRHLVRQVLDAAASTSIVPWRLDSAAQPRQELAPRGAVLVQLQGGRDLRLGGVQKGAERTRSRQCSRSVIAASRQEPQLPCRKVRRGREPGLGPPGWGAAAYWPACSPARPSVRRR